VVCEEMGLVGGSFFALDALRLPSNIFLFLHHVVDGWFVKEVKPRMKGRCLLVRFADDFVIGCEVERDARRRLEMLPKRFARLGLSIHPEKTALIPFRRPDSKRTSEARNRTLDFLGLTHCWARSR
jgi:RNA-directed DNA polymerase